jgi:transcriptional regulator with XRE-family HTH domain
MMTITLRRGRAPVGTYPEAAQFARWVRLELGLSQPRLAELVGRSARTWGHWEAGQMRVPETAMRRLAELMTWKRTGVAPWWARVFD